MVEKVDIQKKNSLLFGTFAVFLLIIGISGNYYFAAQSLLLRVVALLAIAGLSLFLLSKTETGKKVWIYWKEALVELRKVVWPTKQETMQSTIGVFTMVVIMGIFLWSIDAILVRIVAWLLRHNGV